ncbi:hypothetical protein Entas_3191 [Enterobacter soli]|nr:hypothetical protein Entas_3191 [Enterobacter soli]
MAGCACGRRNVEVARSDALTPTSSTGEGKNTKNGNLRCNASQLSGMKPLCYFSGIVPFTQTFLLPA